MRQGYVTRDTYDVFYGGTVDNIAKWKAGACIDQLHPEQKSVSGSPLPAAERNCGG